MHILIWIIAAGTIAGVIFRPKQWPEAVWAALGAALLIATGLVPARAALGAIAQGTGVYFFLAGMMLLAELARREGVFDWLAALAVRASKHSRARLFALIYAVGITVTVLLSNDATAVVLTPAVYAAVKKARADPLTYLFICAFIANAASFVLPISNPANLIVYGSALPPLGPWLRTFAAPSIVSIVATYAALRWLLREHLGGEIEEIENPPALSRDGRRALWGIVATGAVLLAASAFGFDLGIPTFAAASLVVAVATRTRLSHMREIAAGIAWSILPMVAGLFVLVEALNRAGTLAHVSAWLHAATALPGVWGELAASFGVAALSNAMNNLPSGLLAGGALKSAQVTAGIRNAVLIGVDLGPNLSVTGSLATLLWLVALRREGVEISGWRFLKAGAIVMPPALFFATIVAGR